MTRSKKLNICKFGALSLFIILCTYPSGGQTVTGQLGGIISNMAIYTDTIKMEVSRQTIISRATSFTSSSTYGDSAYGYGYGYQSYHLEFITDRLPVEVYKKGVKRPEYMITLLNRKREAIYRFTVKQSEIRIIASIEKDPHFAYSIDLKNIPLILFDHLLGINIVKISNDR